MRSVVGFLPAVLVAGLLLAACSTIPPGMVSEAIPDRMRQFGAAVVQTLGDPSVPGAYEHTVFRYASPRNPRGPSYAEDAVSAVATPVDVSEYGKPCGYPPLRLALCRKWIAPSRRLRPKLLRSPSR